MKAVNSEMRDCAAEEGDADGGHWYRVMPLRNQVRLPWGEPETWQRKGKLRIRSGAEA